MTIFGGCILRWLIFPTPQFIYLSFILKIIVLIVCLLGGLTGYLLSI